LPVPYGLIRTGVAPDHQSIKGVSRRYEATALSENVRFVGNVTVGQDVSIAELQHLYDAVVLATGAPMTWPMDLPSDLQGLVPDLRQAIAELLRSQGPQSGTAVIYDLDQSDGTYVAAEYLRDRFDRVVVLSPRETIAEEVVLVGRQRIHRRFFERGIEVKTWVDPVWTERFENEGCLQYRSVFGGPLQDIPDVAFFAYASARRPLNELHQPLLAAGVNVTLVGDCRIARDALAATAEGYAAGMAV